MDRFSLPSSLDEVEALILVLYGSSSPSSISTTQATLQRVQQTPQAWSLARQLLARPDPKVKFFGALTLIVKLNTESSSLTTDDASELLRTLVELLLQSLVDGSGSLVVRKLVSALATFFLRFPRRWTQCVNHMTYCLAQNQFCSEDEFGPSANILPALRSLTGIRLRVALWFATTIAEDALRTDLASPLNIGLEQAVVSNVSHVAALISAAHTISQIDRTPVSNENFQDSIKCLQAWIQFCQRTSLRDASMSRALRPLIQPVIQSLLIDAHYEASADLMSEIMSNYSTFLTEEHYESFESLIDTEPFRQRYHQMIQCPDEGSVLFGQLLLSLGDAQVQQLIRANGDTSRVFLDRLCGLLAASGHPAVEDKIFQPAIEFWSTFVETLIDETYSENSKDSPWVTSSIEYVQRAISLAWQKIFYPPAEVLREWSADDRTIFTEAKQEFADFLQATTMLLGSRLISDFATITLEALSVSDWLRLEASAFCLGAFADCTVSETSHEEALHKLFSRELFEKMHTENKQMPLRTRQTCANLVEKYANYFESRPDVLPLVLNVLISLLSEPQMTGPTSRSMYRLCDSCRKHLVTEAGVFLQHYGVLASRGGLDCPTSEKVMGSIAAILQAFPDGDDKFTFLSQLLAYVENDLRLGLADRPSEATVGLCQFLCSKEDRCSLWISTLDTRLHLTLRSLRCLVGIGKGLKNPADGPIDLEAEYDRFAAKPFPAIAELQHRILSMVHMAQSTFPLSGDLVEAVCSIFRSGFSETEPGLFVFLPEPMCAYFTAQSIAVPRIGLFVSTARSFLSSCRSSSAESLTKTRTQLLEWVIGLLRSLPEHDPNIELSQNGIDFVGGLLSKDPAVLFGMPDAAEFLFLFTLRMLERTEPLPKSSAGGFWTLFLSLSPETPELKQMYENAMIVLGPLVTRNLVRNIGGLAARSELDRLAEPLKRLVGRHRQARVWLEAALDDEMFSASSVTVEQRTFFLKSLISLRGTKPTNQAVRDFWLLAQGSKFSYAS